MAHDRIVQPACIGEQLHRHQQLHSETPGSEPRHSATHAQRSGHGAGASTTANPQPKPHSLPYLAGTEVIYNSQSPPGWWCLHRTPCSRRLTAPERGWQLQRRRRSWLHQRMCGLEGCTRGGAKALNGSPEERRVATAASSGSSRQAASQAPSNHVRPPVVPCLHNDACRYCCYLVCASSSPRIYPHHAKQELATR